MKTYHILLPLAAGSESENIIESGIHLASALKAKLTFLYILSPSQYTAYAGSGAIMATSSIANMKEQEEFIQTHYLKTLEKHKKHINTAMAIERIVFEGQWVTSIVEYAGKHNPDMLLLQHEEQSFLEKILGDTNTEIINQVNIPVWIIPDKDSLKMPGKVAYLTDHRQGDLEALKHLSHICKLINTSIHIVHVGGEDEFESEIKKEGFISILSRELADCNFSHEEVKQHKLIANVQQLIDENNYALLVMRNESENFLNRFFTRSSVEKVMNSVGIPLAIYS